MKTDLTYAQGLIDGETKGREDERRRNTTIIRDYERQIAELKREITQLRKSTGLADTLREYVRLETENSIRQLRVESARREQNFHGARADQIISDEVETYVDHDLLDDHTLGDCPIPSLHFRPLLPEEC